jgi:hypothetical protein
MKKIITLWFLFGGWAFGSPLKIDALSFNIRFDNPKDGENAWPKRKKMVAQWLKTESPDIVGLQEAMRHQIDDIRKGAPIYVVFDVWYVMLLCIMLCNVVL